MNHNSSSLVITLNAKQQETLHHYVKEMGFDLSSPPHTLFCAKKKGLTCTLYLSGKLVIQGKESKDFIEFYLEPEILHNFHLSYPDKQQDMHSHIGVDESGKGDLFGPLCIAGVFVRKDQFDFLESKGVKDSKKLEDPVIQQLARVIKKECIYHIVKINPLKYNQIYKEFNNLNTLLAWGHATVIEQLTHKANCNEVIIDQFANEQVVEKALKRKALTVHLTQRHRAEEDLAVAAASILARDTYLEGLKQLGDSINMILPKGCSHNVITVGREIARRFGQEKLPELCKMHFKTLNSICVC